MANQTPAKVGPSTATRPDLDWSQVRETVAMLYLAIGQIKATLADTHQEISQLTNSFTLIANQAGAIHHIAAQLISEESEQSTQLELCANSITTEVSRSIQAFQFHDRISQKMEHVAQSLKMLSELIANPSQLYNPAAWQAVQGEIRSSYSMECERIMFEHIMRGASIEEALEIYRHHFSEKEQEGGDEVELF